MEPPQDTAQFQFSTEAFPARERLSAWREIFGRTVCNLDITPVDRDGFQSQATVCQLPRLGVLFASSDAVHLSHNRDLIKDDDLSFMAAPTCAWTASQLGRCVECGPGDGVLMTNAEVGSLDLAAASRFTTFRVPRASIEPLVADLDAAIARVIPAGSPELQLLVNYLTTALDTAALVTPKLQQLAVTHVHDLLAMALGATREADETARGRGVRAARLRAIRADILANLNQQELSIGTVAMRHGITPVYIRKLFESEGTSFSKFVLQHRLTHAYQVLRDRQFVSCSIAMVAFQVGFSDLSYFNRTFRRRFHCTPSDVRDTAWRT